MAMPTPVNGQITGAVTQTNVKVLGEAPGFKTETKVAGKALSIYLFEQQLQIQILSGRIFQKRFNGNRIADIFSYVKMAKHLNAENLFFGRF